MSTLNQGLGVKAGGAGGGGGSDTNLGNTDLTADAARIYKNASGQTLTFKNNAGTNALQVDNSANVKIGGATPYTMPNARGTINEVLGLTDSAGTAAWRTVTETIKTVQETPAVNNSLVPSALTVNNVYVSETVRKGRWSSLGLVTITSLSAAVGQTINNTEPFRQIGSTNIQMTGTMYIKFTSAALGTYDFYVVKLTQTTGTPIATTPVTFTAIGSVAIGERGANLWQCLEYSTDSVTADACSSYYFAILPRQSQTESWICVAHWAQDDVITKSFS